MVQFHDPGLFVRKEFSPTDCCHLHPAIGCPDYQPQSCSCQWMNAVSVNQAKVVPASIATHIRIAGVLEINVRLVDLLLVVVF